MRAQMTCAFALVVVVGCSLNPQPLPPETDDGGAIPSEGTIASGGGDGGTKGPGSNYPPHDGSAGVDVGSGGSGGSSGWGGGEAGLDSSPYEASLDAELGETSTDGAASDAGDTLDGGDAGPD